MLQVYKRRNFTPEEL